VNVWLEDAQPPLWVGGRYTVGVDVSRPFAEPDWGDRTELPLVVALSGKGAVVDPAWQRATLPQDGAMPAVYFVVVPQEEGELELCLGLYLARELTLLEKFVVSLEIFAAPTEVVP
jgi:hypothetical protein